MTIENELQYESTKKALDLAEKALKALREEMLPGRPEEYEAFSEAYIDYVYKLRHEIDEYIGLQSAEESAMPLWIRLRGPRISDRVPMSVLSDFLKDLRYGVYQVSKYDMMTSKSEDRRLKDSELRRLTNAKVKIMPGSLKIGLAFPPGQMLVDGKTVEDYPGDAMKKILAGASWSADPGTEGIEDLLPNPVERHLVLTHVEKLSRTRGGEISSIEFRGKQLRKSFELTNESARVVKKAMMKELPPELATFEGIVREVDLDEKHFTLRISLPAGGEERRQCQYDPEYEEDVKNSLDKRVKVMGESRPVGIGKPPIKAILIEQLESEDE
jgi:hypothetical protein